MAETEAIFKLRVDTGNSVNDVENLTSAVKETQTATEGKGVTDFEKKLNQLDKTLAEGNLTFRQRSRLIKEYQQIALQAGEASPVGDRAVRSAAALTDQLGDMNQRVRLLSSDTVRLDTALQGISVGAAAFQGVQSAIALTGVENEQLIQSMQKLQAVQGVVNSIQAITNALNKDAILGIQLRVALEKAKNFVMTGSIAGTVTLSAAEKELGASTLFTANAMKVLRVALIALGIPALIILIGYLVTNFDKVTKAVSGAYERVMRFADGVKGLRLLLLPLEIAVVGVRIALEKLGLIENDQDRKREANHNAQLKRIEAQLKKQEEANKRRERAFTNEQKAYEREIALLDSVGKSSLAVSKMKIQASIDYQKEKLKELQQEFKAIEFLSKSSEFYAKFYGTERMEILRTSLNDAEQAIKDSETQLQVLINTDNKKKVDAAKQHEKQLQEMFKKQDAERLEATKKVNDYISGLLNESDQDALKRFEKEIAEEERREQKRLDLIRAYNEVVMSEYELEALDFQENQQKKSHYLAAAFYNNLITNEEYNNALEVLLKDQAEFEVDLEKRKQEAIKAERDKAFQEQVQQIEKVIGITQQFVGVTNALNGLLNASDQERLKQVKGNAVEEEKIKRRMFERDKKQRIAQTAIDTAANVVRSVANGGGIPAGIPFGIAAGAMGALQIAAISKQSFDGSSGGGSFNAPPPSTQAPVTTANETNPNNVGNNLPKMTKVVVLESDISNVQNKVKVTETLSGF
jgi:hypothetical protein